MFICVHIVYGSFCATMAKLKSFDKDYMALKA